MQHVLKNVSTAIRFFELIKKILSRSDYIHRPDRKLNYKARALQSQTLKFLYNEKFVALFYVTVLNNLTRCNDCQSVENWCLTDQCGVHLNANVYDENDGDRGNGSFASFQGPRISVLDSHFPKFARYPISQAQRQAGD